MDFASSLEVRQTRTLTMTSQLRQAIGLLQFNNAELSRFLTREAQKNPLLEIRLGQGPADRRSGTDRGRPVATAGGAASGSDFRDTLPAASDSLLEHVTHQIGLNIHDEDQRRIALAFLEELEPYGWLGVPVSEIAGATTKARIGMGTATTAQIVRIFARLYWSPSRSAATSSL